MTKKSLTNGVVKTLESNAEDILELNGIHKKSNNLIVGICNKLNIREKKGDLEVNTVNFTL